MSDDQYRTCFYRIRGPGEAALPVLIRLVLVRGQGSRGLDVSNMDGQTSPAESIPVLRFQPNSLSAVVAMSDGTCPTGGGWDDRGGVGARISGYDPLDLLCFAIRPSLRK